MACGLGEYIGIAGQTVCLQCSAGTFSDAPGQTECVECQPGEYQDQPGSSGCVACAPGRYSVATKAETCAACDPGKFTPFNGSTVCQECGAGEFQSQPGMESCELCPVGRYSAGGLAECMVCGVGAFAQPFAHLGFRAAVRSGYVRQRDRSVGLRGLPGGHEPAAARYDCRGVCVSLPSLMCIRTPAAGESSCVSCEPGTYSPTRSTGTHRSVTVPPGTTRVVTSVRRWSRWTRRARRIDSSRASRTRGSRPFSASSIAAAGTRVDSSSTPSKRAVSSRTAATPRWRTSSQIGRTFSRAASTSSSARGSTSRRSPGRDPRRSIREITTPVYGPRPPGTGSSTMRNGRVAARRLYNVDHPYPGA